MSRPNTASFAPLMMMMTSYFGEHTALPFVMLNLFQRQFICLIVSPRRHERGNGILMFCFFFCDWWAHRLSIIIIVTPVMIDRIEEGVSLGSTHMLNELWDTGFSAFYRMSKESYLELVRLGSLQSGSRMPILEEWMLATFRMQNCSVYSKE